MMDRQITGDVLWERAFAREVDRLSVERYKIPALVLMETAGRAICDAVQACGVAGKQVLVLAGTGNNGGDALVAARHLLHRGCELHVTLVAADPSSPRFSAACNAQIEIMRALGVELPIYTPGAFAKFRRRDLLILDGVLGLGFRGELDSNSLLYQALREAAQLDAHGVFAIDLPSGLDCDTGDFETSTIKPPLAADVTITFGGKKPAHVLAPARDICGEIVIADIGFPHQAQDDAMSQYPPSCVLADAPALLRHNPWAKLSRSAHKYDRGHVLVIGGSIGKTGAPLMAATAALRAGAGWSSVSMPRSALDDLRGDVAPELTFEPLFDHDALNATKLERFLEERNVRAVVAGPGCMSNPLTPDAVAVLAKFSTQGGFVVLDAGATQDAFQLLEGHKLAAEKWLLTPHPGEWRRLGPEFNFKPLSPAGMQLALKLARRLGAALLYKSATPVLFSGLGQTPAFVTDEGTLSLARAGSGDVFAGAAAAHGAIGLSSSVAALRAHVLISWAAILAGRELGEHAVLAHDIMTCIGRVPELLANTD